jgi:hypothetical protein
VFREPPELFVIRQPGAHLAEDLSTDELGVLFASINIVELVIRTVSAWMFGVLAGAAGFTTTLYWRERLPGRTARCFWSRPLIRRICSSSAVFQALEYSSYSARITNYAIGDEQPF